MPWSAAPVHVVAAVADHHHPLGQRAQLVQRVGQDVGLAGSRAVHAGAGDHLEVAGQAEVVEDPPGGRLGLGGGHRQPHPGGAQVGEQLRDPVEQGVHRPAAAGVVGPVGGDRVVGQVAETHALQGVVHRRPDDPRRPGRRPEPRRPTRRVRAGSWPRCRRRSRSACRRDRRSPTAGGCRRPCVSRTHCSRWRPGAAGCLPIRLAHYCA